MPQSKGLDKALSNPQKGIAEDIDGSISDASAKTMVLEADELLANDAKDAQQFQGKVEDRVIRLFDELVESTKENTASRKSLAKIIYRLVQNWLAFMAFMIAANGYGLMETDSSVMNNLITSATVAIIALLSTVVAYYFTDRGVGKEVFTKLIDYVDKRK